MQQIEFLGTISEFQSEERHRLYRPDGAILIMGVGGLGWWMVAALMRCADINNHLIIYDNDNFVGGNGAARLPIPSQPVRLKVTELKEWLADWLPEPSVVNNRLTIRTTKATPFQLNYVSIPLRMILDCTDAPLSDRQAIYTWASNKGVPYYRGSYDGELITWSNVPPVSIVNDGGYSLIPNMAVTFAAGGMIAECVRRTLLGETILPFTHNFGMSWRAAEEELSASVGTGLAEEIEHARRIQEAIDEGDPWVIGEDGDFLGRQSEFYDEIVAEPEMELPVSDVEFSMQHTATQYFPDIDAVDIQRRFNALAARLIENLYSDGSDATVPSPNNLTSITFQPATITSERDTNA